MLAQCHTTPDALFFLNPLTFLSIKRKPRVSFPDLGHEFSVYLAHYKQFGERRPKEEKMPQRIGQNL